MPRFMVRQANPEPGRPSKRSHGFRPARTAEAQLDLSRLVPSLLVILCMFAAQTLLLVVLPLAADSAGVPGSGIGIIVAVPGVLGLLTDLPSAALSDQFGRRLMLVGGGVLGALAALIAAVEPSLMGLVSSMFLFGGAMSILGSSALSLLTEVAHSERQEYIQGLNGSVQRLGAVAAGALVAVLSQSPGLGFAVVAALCIAIALFGAAVRIPVPSARSRLSWADLPRSYRHALDFMLTRASIRMSTAINLHLNVLFVAGTSFLSLFVLRSLRATPGFFGLLLVTRDLSAVITSPLFGRLTGRFGWFRVVLATGLSSSISLALIPFVNDYRLLFPLLAVQGVAIGFEVAATNLLVTRGTDSSERAVGIAATGFVGRLGSIVLPVVFGWALGLGGPTALFGCAGAVATCFVLAIVPDYVATHTIEADVPVTPRE